VSVELNPALLAPGVVGNPQTGRPTGGRTADAEGTSGPSFAEVLKGATGEAGTAGVGAATPGSQAASGAEALHFSKHALERVQRRGIALDPSTLGRLHEGVGRAAGKGSRDSLVLVDGTAFVVSVPNRTVITAVGSEHMREQIFTNIDSAVIA
jgi:flagellar operon protein